MTGFILFVLGGILQLVIVAIFASAILSWLVAFNVINVRNNFVYGIVRFLDAVTAPVLAPFRKIIPSLGGVDVSPIVAILILQGIRGYLLPWLAGLIYPLIG